MKRLIAALKLLGYFAAFAFVVWMLYSAFSLSPFMGIFGTLAAIYFVFTTDWRSYDIIIAEHRASEDLRMRLDKTARNCGFLSHKAMQRHYAAKRAAEATAPVEPLSSPEPVPD